MTEDRNLSILIEGCRRKSEASQLALYRLYYSYGMGTCLRYARNRESALEMLNDGFLKVFLNIGKYNPAYPFKPWLRKILVNAAIDHYRKYEQKQPDVTWQPNVHTIIYNKALERLEFEDLLLIVQKLPPAYQMVFNLYVVENMSHEEIAEQLGISVGTSKSNLSKARKKIKNLLGSALDIHLKF